MNLVLSKSVQCFIAHSNSSNITITVMLYYNPLLRVLNESSAPLKFEFISIIV